MSHQYTPLPCSVARLSKKKENKRPGCPIWFELQMNEKWIWPIRTLCFIWQYYQWGLSHSAHLLHACSLVSLGVTEHGSPWKLNHPLTKGCCQRQNVSETTVSLRGIIHSVCGLLGDRQPSYHWNASMHVWVSSFRLCLPKRPRREGRAMLGSGIESSDSISARWGRDSNEAVTTCLGSLLNPKIP